MVALNFPFFYIYFLLLFIVIIIIVYCYYKLLLVFFIFKNLDGIPSWWRWWTSLQWDALNISVLTYFPDVKVLLMLTIYLLVQTNSFDKGGQYLIAVLIAVVHTHYIVDDIVIVDVVLLLLMTLQFLRLKPNLPNLPQL